MPFKTDGCSTYIALVLAATAAIMSAPGRTADAHQILQFLVSSAAPEATVIAGAIGDDTRTFVAP